MAIDYFAKWVEAELLVSIIGNAVQKFFWKNIVCRFSVPKVIISDNGRQFAENPFKRWCTEMNIAQHFTSVGHPQANGQAENFNRTLLQGLKKGLHQTGSTWAEHLPNVVWSYRTTPRKSTQETPFSMTYGTEAMLPTEVITPSLRNISYLPDQNAEYREMDLNLLEERRKIATRKTALYQSTIARHYNARVKHLYFKPGDLVLRKNSVSRAEPTGKLSPKWEGPYRIAEISQNGYCKLTYRDGSLVPRTWHTTNLKMYYA